MLKLIEDFNTAYDWSITRAVASAVHVAGPSFNARNHFVEINVAWRAQREGNPATLFRAKSACIKPDPQGFSNDVMRVSCNKEDDHNKKTIPPEYVAYMLVRYALSVASGRSRHPFEVKYGTWTTKLAQRRR
ncbi:hypothetical protein LshimejAT787_1001840 [Lyophyllum shimeji]|uniref:Uncharacterized protein n=1 Tax=Lyophyllum shimeji TaxID=47721 RepID=A0A9P3PU33_LYOSH|nr:hypothetical protein LshimejAT787_1001840 [Lyophyllum shimeji]